MSAHRRPAATVEHGYVPHLDGLRALAVAGVVAGHAGARLGGYHGVTVFFVLSGFLITSLLRAERRRTGRVDWRSFYRRRAARLGPGLLLVLAATTAWLVASGTGLAQCWRELLYAATWTTDLALPVDPAARTTGLVEWSWSLGVEEQFYLVWPVVLVLVAARRFPDRWLVGVCLALTAAIWVDRAWLVDASHARLFYAPDTHLDAMLLGAVVSVLAGVEALRRRWVAVVATAVGALGLAAVVYRPGVLFTLVPIDGGGFGSVALLAAALLLGLALWPGQPLARVLSLRPLAHLGRLSYGLYLWNLLTVAVFRAVTGVAPLESWWGLAWLAGLLVVVELAYLLVERPARAWLARPRRPRTTPDHVVGSVTPAPAVARVT